MKRGLTIIAAAWLFPACASASEDLAVRTAHTAFTGVFSDSAANVDGDSFYEYLVISAQVHITSPGRHYLEGSLSYDLDYLISHRPDWLSTTPLNFVSLECDTGLVTFHLPFSGEDVYRSGFDGSYEVGLSLYRYPSEADSNVKEKSLIGMESLDHRRINTAEYNHNDFREFDAEIKGFGILNLEIEETVDTSGNGLFDMLDATVSIGTLEEGLFNLKAHLMGSRGRIATFMRLVSIRTGPNPASLSFPGSWIYESGQDGPYTIDVTLTETRGKRFARKRFTTEGKYNHLDFEPATTVKGGPATIINN